LTTEEFPTVVNDVSLGWGACRGAFRYLAVVRGRSDLGFRTWSVNFFRPLPDAAVLDHTAGDLALFGGPLFEFGLDRIRVRRVRVIDKKTPQHAVDDQLVVVGRVAGCGIQA